MAVMARALMEKSLSLKLLGRFQGRVQGFRTLCSLQGFLVLDGIWCVCVCVCVRACVRASERAFARAQVASDICMFMYVVCAQWGICMYVHIYVRTHKHMHAHTHTHTHTHTHMNMQSSCLYPISWLQ